MPAAQPRRRPPSTSGKPSRKEPPHRVFRRRRRKGRLEEMFDRRRRLETRRTNGERKSVSIGRSDEGRGYQIASKSRLSVRILENASRRKRDVARVDEKENQLTTSFVSQKETESSSPRYSLHLTRLRILLNRNTHASSSVRQRDNGERASGSRRTRRGSKKKDLEPPLLARRKERLTLQQQVHQS